MAVLRHQMSPVLPAKMLRGHLRSLEVEEVDEVADEVDIVTKADMEAVAAAVEDMGEDHMDKVAVDMEVVAVDTEVVVADMVAKEDMEEEEMVAVDTGVVNMVEEHKDIIKHLNFSSLSPSTKFYLVM